MIELVAGRGKSGTFVLEGAQVQFVEELDKVGGFEGFYGWEGVARLRKVDNYHGGVVGGREVVGGGGPAGEKESGVSSSGFFFCARWTGKGNSELAAWVYTYRKLTYIGFGLPSPEVPFAESGEKEEEEEILIGPVNNGASVSKSEAFEPADGDNTGEPAQRVTSHVANKATLATIISDPAELSVARFHSLTSLLPSSIFPTSKKNPLS